MMASRGSSTCEKRALKGDDSKGSPSSAEASEKRLGREFGKHPICYNRSELRRRDPHRLTAGQVNFCYFLSALWINHPCSKEQDRKNTREPLSLLNDIEINVNPTSTYASAKTTAPIR
jgi:hypothetical protein